LSDSEKKTEPNKLFYRMQSEDIDLTTDIRTSILAQTPKGGRAITWMIFALFVLFMVWAYFSNIEQVTRGDGKVIPSSQIQIVQNLEGGILSEILVDVGEMVKKDQLLLRIDETRFSSSFKQNRAKYLSYKARAARLLSEANGTSFEVPQEVIDEKPEIGVREQELFESRKREFQSNMDILQEQISQREHEYKELTTKLEELTRTYAILQKELELTRPLISQGAVSEVEVLHLERQASQMQGEIATIKQTIPKAQSRLQEAQLALRENQLVFFNKAKSELNEVLAELVVIEAKIKPADIAFLRPNQEAKVKFTAYDFTIYGGLDAKLEHISADSITDEKGNSYYLVRLRTDKNYLGPESDPLPIIPGMVASVDILTGEKTVLAYLLKPVLRAKYMALREQ